MRVYPFDEAKRARWEAEGRGTGEGAEYQGWLRYEDLNSEGNKHRALEGRHGRMCALFSDVEHRLFLGLDAAKSVLELYDQYKLPIEETRNIAKILGITHPRDPQTGVDINITTDLVAITRTSDGRVSEMPWSCKYSSKLGDFNVAEHQEVERLYWVKRHGKLHICTERTHCISDIHFNNLMLLYPHRLIDRKAELMKQAGLGYDERSQIVVQEILAAKARLHVMDFIDHLASEFGLTKLQWTGQLYNLIYRHKLRANLLSGDLRQTEIQEIASLSKLGNGSTVRRVA
ncbi:MAG: TnsA endonuclease N-terminal domain-containing protein [Comamonadaceae bacterium]